LGAIVDVAEVYQTVKPDYSQQQLHTLFKDSAIDIITFTSPSTVDNFLALLKGISVFKEILKAKVACIGPITAQRAAEKGLKVDIVPDEYTADALTRAIVEFYDQC
jgi:uroporphyrinogen-III synthase